MADWVSAVALIKVANYRGTGFLVSADGLVLTAFHVVADRQASIEARKPQFYPGPITVRFGDGNNKTWDGGVATVVENRFSMMDDWVLLKVAPQRIEAEPVAVAQLTEPREQRAFTTFGFPKLDSENGGVYAGTIGLWSDVQVEI